MVNRNHINTGILTKASEVQEIGKRFKNNLNLKVLKGNVLRGKLLTTVPVSDNSLRDLFLVIAIAII